MPVNADFLKKLIQKHNDPEDPTRIFVIQGTSMSNFFPSRMNSDEEIKVEDNDIVWNEPSMDCDGVMITTRTGINNIDLVRYTTDISHAEGKGYRETRLSQKFLKPENSQ